MKKTTVVMAVSMVALSGAAFVVGRNSEPVELVDAPAPPFKTAVVVVPVQTLTLPPATPEVQEPVREAEPPPTAIVAVKQAPVADPQVQALANEVEAVRETIADDDQTRSDTQAEADGHDEAVRSAMDGLRTAEANLADGDTDGLQAAIDAARDSLGDSAEPLLTTARDRLDNEDLNGVRDALAVLLAKSHR